MSKELKNSIKIKVGQAAVELLIKIIIRFDSLGIGLLKC